jgi:predicted house-cleaning noncanonical NTP pyrophosphatase (MazG superfamily)
MKEYKKLVRDRVVSRIKAEGKQVTWHLATAEEFKDKIGRKLFEEINEFANALNPEELIDVIEVVLGIEKRYQHARPSEEAIAEWLAGVLSQDDSEEDAVSRAVPSLDDAASAYVISRSDAKFGELVIELERIIRITGFDRATLEAMRLKKLETHGGFETGIILDSVADA